MAAAEQFYRMGMIASGMIGTLSLKIILRLRVPIMPIMPLAIIPIL